MKTNKENIKTDFQINDLICLESATEIPDTFFCPITLDVMECPFVAADGFSYEYEAIAEWFKKGNKSSPQTGAMLAHTELIENISLRIAINEFRKKINIDYQYEDNDIQAILSSRLRQLIEISPQYREKPIHVLAAVDDIMENQLEQRLKQEKNENQGKRIILIPCNLRNSHWVGIIIEISADEKILRAEYTDSLSESVSEKLQKQFIATYPNDELVAIESLKQDDSSSCGAYVVENFLLSIQKAEALGIDIKQIRFLHLECLKQYNPEFYQAFYIRQRDNKPTIASIQEQLGYVEKSKEIWFSKSELFHILKIKEILGKFSDSAIKKSLLEAFSFKSEAYSDTVNHLNMIRAAVKKVSLSLKKGDERDKILFRNLIKLLFDIDWEINTEIFVDDLKFYIEYEQILAITKNDISMTEVQKIQENLNKQIQEDEVLLQKLQAQLWAEIWEDTKEKTIDPDEKTDHLKNKELLPSEIKCGLCEDLLNFNGPTVTCDYGSEVAEEDVRCFHEKCLQTYFDEYVIAPNNPSKKMRTDYTLVKLEEISQETLCCLSGRRGKLIINPVRGGDGKIYQEKELKEYLIKAKTLLWNRVIVDRKIKSLSRLENRDIKRMLSDYGFSELSSIAVTEEQDDTFKILIFLNDQLNSLFSGEKSKFEDERSMELLRSTYDTVINEKGELTLTLKDMKQIEEQFAVLRTKFWSQDKWGTLWAYSNSVKGSAGVTAAIVLKQAYQIGLSVKALLQATRVAVTPWAIVPIGIMLIAKNRERQFSSSIQEAIQHYNTAVREGEKAGFEKAERILEMEFGRGKEGRYAPIRAIRWVQTSYDDYAFAHLLLAEVKTQLERETSYQEFSQAFNDARESRIKAMSLIGMIKLLSPLTKNELKINDRVINESERKKLLNEKIGILNDSYQDMVNWYFDVVRQTCQSILLAIRKKENFLKSLAEINHFLNFKDLPLIRYMKPHGKLCEVIFTCTQGACLVMFNLYGIKPILHAKEDEEIQLEKISELARKKLEECWCLIKEFGFADKIGIPNSREGMISGEIKGYICRFFKEYGKNNTLDENLKKHMLDLGLIDKLESDLSADEILTIIKNFVNANDNENPSLQRILDQLLVSEELSKFRFDGNRTWLHYLPKLSTSSFLVEKAQKAARKIISLKISPYERDVDGNTAFMCIPKDDQYKWSLLYCDGKLGRFFGLDEQIQRIKNFLKKIKFEPSAESHFLLLAGPPGLGKTELIRELSTNYGYILNEFERGSEDDRYVGQLEYRIQKFFDDSKKMKKPVCLFIDEIDVICPIPSKIAGSYNPDAIVALIQMEIDKLKGTKCVLVGASNYLSNIKAAIKNRAGIPVMFQLPDCEMREKILKDQLRMVKLKDETIIGKIAEATASWSPRLLIKYINDVLSKAGSMNVIGNEIFMDCFEPMRQCLKEDYKQMNVEPPKLKKSLNVGPYENLVGLNDNVKKELDGLCLFLNNPEAYTSRLEVRKNILLYGPPGTGKSSFARTIANYSNVLFVSVEAGKYKLPGSEMALDAIFNIAKNFEKAVIFIDEIDAIAHDSAVTREILQTAMDGFIKIKTTTLVVIGATNYLEDIAEPVLSRFKKVQVPLPNEAQRIQLFSYYINNIRMDFDQILRANFSDRCHLLAKESDGLSQRDIRDLIEQAVITITDQEQNEKKKIPLAFQHIYHALETKKKEIADQQDSRDKKLRGTLFQRRTFV